MATNPFDPRMESYRGYLRVLAYSMMQRSPILRGKLDVSDIVQEVLLQAHVALTQFQGETEEEFAAWLRATLANKWTDAVRHYRRGKRDAALERSIREALDSSTQRLEQLCVDKQTSPRQAVLQQERLLFLVQALEALPEGQRTAIELHHVAEYKVTEVAQIMGRSTAGVAGLLRRGLQGLRKSLHRLETE